MLRFLKSGEAGIALALLILFAGLSWGSPEFLSADNLLTVARQFSVYGIIAVGMTFVIVAGEIDLSVGSVLALSACLSARLVVEHAWPLGGAMAAAIAAGAAAGWVNGALTVGLGIPSFIITLGMMSVVRGVTYVFTGAMPISGLPDGYLFLGSGTLFGVTVPVVTMAVVAVAGGVILKFTSFGRAVYAVGGNLEAARLAGVATNRVRILCFTCLGALAALAGMLTAGWVTVAQPVAGEGYELDVIAAVIIGGSSFSGGKGTVLGTMLGATLMGVLRNGLILLGVDVNWQKVAIGAVIVMAVMLDRLRRRI
ncbi:MAG: ABC transporter permease [Candidatus Coatesbacteria bacterium]